jgi:hypothetical protein
MTTDKSGKDYTTMTQAIVTKYLGPSSTRPGRIKATAWGGSVTVEYSHECDSEMNHVLAAQALCRKLGWTTKGWLGGGTPDGKGWAFVSQNTYGGF